MAAIFETLIEPEQKVENTRFTKRNWTTPSPSVGRIVVYNYPGGADGKFAPKQSPAMVQKMNEDGTVETIVFSVYGIFFNHGVTRGNGPSQWN